MSLTAPGPKEAVLVVNAHSRKGQALFREAVDKLAAAGVVLTSAHALRDPSLLVPTVKEAVRSGAPMVIVGGGDGSLSYTVDEVVGRDCVFALLPLGTANSFARTLGIPHKLKRHFGRVGYLIWAIWCFIRFSPFRLSVDDGTKEHRLWATEVRIFNGRFHGGVELIESADVESGQIVVQAVRGRSVVKLGWSYFASAMKLKARHVTMKEFRGRKLVVSTRPPMAVSIDGEVAATTPLEVSAIPNAVTVAAPRT